MVVAGRGAPSHGAWSHDFGGRRWTGMQTDREIMVRRPRQRPAAGRIDLWLSCRQATTARRDGTAQQTTMRLQRAVASARGPAAASGARPARSHPTMSSWWRSQTATATRSARSAGAIWPASWRSAAAPWAIRSRPRTSRRSLSSGSGSRHRAGAQRGPGRHLAPSRGAQSLLRQAGAKARGDRQRAARSDRSGARAGRQVDERQMADCVRAALGSLPDAQRSAITLCHYQGMRNIEAAEVMGVSIEAMESLLARGRRKLREELRVLAPELLVRLAPAVHRSAAGSAACTRSSTPTAAIRCAGRRTSAPTRSR